MKADENYTHDGSGPYPEPYPEIGMGELKSRRGVRARFRSSFRSAGGISLGGSNTPFRAHCELAVGISLRPSRRSCAAASGQVLTGPPRFWTRPLSTGGCCMRRPGAAPAWPSARSPGFPFTANQALLSTTIRGVHLMSDYAFGRTEGILRRRGLRSDAMIFELWRCATRISLVRQVPGRALPRAQAGF